MLLSRMKEAAVGSGLGRIANSLRRYWRLVSSEVEQRGWLANDDLAEYYVTRICEPGKVFVDAGAHIGAITAAVLRNCPGVQIVAIEAIPDKAARLRRRFPSATVLSVAIAEQNGHAMFNVDMDNTAWSTLAENDRRVRKIEVETRRLDDLDLSGVGVLKLDLEGAELGALRSGERLIGRDRPTIMFESGPTDYLGYTKEAKFGWFKERGYWLYLPARLGKGAAPMTWDVFLDSHQYPFGTLNYFAIPVERVSEIARRVEHVGPPR